MTTIFLGMGSNLGDRANNIQQAAQLLCQKNIIIEKMAPIIETEPVGGPPQAKYLNTVLKAQTHLTPYELLRVIKGIEQQLGRVPTGLNGPRPIDIDILIYNLTRLTTPELTIPHPRLRERAFVMQPLLEIEPNAVNIFQL